MAQFGPVAPIQILKSMLAEDIRVFGNYHLFLAHHTVEKPKDFEGLLREYNYHMSMRQAPGTFIMDNSIVELGGAVDDKMVAEATNICLTALGNRHRVIPVLPDVMGDGQATVEASSAAYHHWKHSMPHNGGFMVVLQASTFEEFCRHVDHFFLSGNYPHITWAGIPRILVKSLGTRKNCVKYLQAVAPHIDIHLLGFSDNVVDDVFSARLRGVRGIDSAVPVRYDYAPFTPTTEVPPRAADWFETGMLTGFGVRNTEAVRSWVRVR